ncbi:MAG: sulfite exporter TauE/SafE family protein [Verrucomicrobiota bacterium]
MRNRFPSSVTQNLDLIFISLIWLVWALSMSLFSHWDLFRENWFMSITMAMGSFIAGSTSQGGGAVAFPAMTLGFGIDPKSARDFSLMIQSIGMTSAAIAIFVRRIAVEKTTLFWAGTGGVIGVFIGLQWIQQWFSPNPTKVFFVSLWLAFGAALWFINRKQSPFRNDLLPTHSAQSRCILFLVGIPGGIISALLGSGLDILVFAVLVLGFRICEKTATPTSVVLMAMISVAGFANRVLFPGTEPISETTWGYWWVCVPIVAVGAPLGSRFISKRGRAFIVRLLLVIILAQFIAALLIIPFSPSLILIAATTFLGGIILFRILWALGTRFTENQTLHD